MAACWRLACCRTRELQHAYTRVLTPAAAAAACLCPVPPQVDKDTFEMLKAINMSGLPGVQLAQVR